MWMNGWEREISSKAFSQLGLVASDRIFFFATEKDIEMGESFEGLELVKKVGLNTPFKITMIYEVRWGRVEPQKSTLLWILDMGSSQL